MADSGLTSENQAKVDEFKKDPSKLSVPDTADVEFNYVYQDEQGPWDVNEGMALRDVAAFQVWLERERRRVRLEVVDYFAIALLPDEGEDWTVIDKMNASVIEGAADHYKAL